MKTLELDPRTIETALVCTQTISRLLLDTAFLANSHEIRAEAERTREEVGKAVAMLQQLRQFVGAEPQIWTLKNDHSN